MNQAAQKLTRNDLWSLEQYATQRDAFRQQIMAHKKNRRVALGPHATLHFEDHLTMKYQVQETLRVERIFNPAEIEEEMATYNPLIPDGSNWKATFMIEYEDVAERKIALTKLIGVEDKVWVRVAGCEKVYPIANEDLERTTADKTSSVHFLRFELDNNMIARLRDGADLAMGIDHPAMICTLDPIPANIRDSLRNDLQ